MLQGQGTDAKRDAVIATDILAELLSD